MTAMQLLQSKPLPTITWEKLPDEFILPDEPVDNNLQPLLASALRESLELAGLILESMLIASILACVPPLTIKLLSRHLIGFIFPQ